MTRLRCSPPLVRVESALRSHGVYYLSLAAEFLLTGSPCCCGRRMGTAPTSRRRSTGRAFRLTLRVGRFGPIPPDAPSVRFSSARPMACQREDLRSTFRLDKDMIALRIGPDFHQALVGAPSYFARRQQPVTPHDLTAHACINLRLPTSGGLWSWPFVKDGRDLKVRAEGPLAFNAIPLILSAALAGLGLAYLPEDVVQQHVTAGRLVRVLADWSPLMTGYHLYYPNRQPSPAFALLVEALRYRS